MEQYVMPKKLDFKHLRMCLDNYHADYLYIRDCGGYDLDGSFRIKGLTKVNEDLEGKTVDFKKDKSGLYCTINSKEVFHFPLKDYDSGQKGFSLAYERINDEGKMIHLSRGIDPDDKNLPDPKRSFLRHILDEHLVEIYFKGKINLKFHSWWIKPDFKYWKIIK